MNTIDEGIDLLRDSRYIRGVHDYCDLWCERCPLSLRCLSRAQGTGGRLALARRSRRNAAYWKTSLEQGQRVDALLARARGASEPPAPACASRDLAAAAHAYAAGSGDWIAATTSLVEDRLDDCWVARKNGLTQARALRRAAALEDAVAVISWYGFLISYKLARALADRAGRSAPGRHQGWFRAPDGNAKTALVSMDRSLAAWADLHGFLPEESSAILLFIDRLDSLRRDVENHFPRARAYVRPGFDALPELAAASPR